MRSINPKYASKSFLSGHQLVKLTRLPPSVEISLKELGDQMLKCLNPYVQRMLWGIVRGHYSKSYWLRPYKVTARWLEPQINKENEKKQLVVDQQVCLSDRFSDGGRYSRCCHGNVTPHPSNSILRHGNACLQTPNLKGYMVEFLFVEWNSVVIGRTAGKEYLVYSTASNE